VSDGLRPDAKVKGDAFASPSFVEAVKGVAYFLPFLPPFFEPAFFLAAIFYSPFPFFMDMQ